MSSPEIRISTDNSPRSSSPLSYASPSHSRSNFKEEHNATLGETTTGLLGSLSGKKWSMSSPNLNSSSNQNASQLPTKQGPFGVRVILPRDMTTIVLCDGSTTADELIDKVLTKLEVIHSLLSSHLIGL